MRLRALLLTAVLCTGCAGLLPIAQDVADITSIVIKDVMAGVPFLQVLKDTGSDDAQLLIAIISAIEADPKLDAPTRALYANKCAPYLSSAMHLAAEQARMRDETP